MDELYGEQKLNVPDSLLNLISQKKTLKDLTFEEFHELVSLPLFETFIYKSFIKKQIDKNDGGLFNTLYIHEELINDLIIIYQELKKIENEENTNYSFNDKITIESKDFKRYISKIQSVLLANNINYLKERVSKFHKSYYDEEKYLEVLNIASASFVGRIQDFDVSKKNKILTFVTLYVDSDIKYFLNKDKILKYPKELILLKKILDRMKESDDCYSTHGYKELMFEIFGNIPKFEVKQIQEIGELYFYILGYGTVTKNKFIEKYYPKDFNKSSIFTNEEDIKIFKKSILEFIKENNEPDFLISSIRDMSVSLDNIDSGCDSLDREIGDENDTVLLGDLVKQDGFSNFEILVYQKSHWDLMDREIRLIGKKPNIPFTLLERIIAGTCINEYFKFKEFRDLLREYGEFKGVGEKYVNNFHTYLSLFKFKDKTDWYQYDEWMLDALTFEQMGDILGFSKEYALRIYKEDVKTKFDFFYGPHGIVFTKYDTGYHGKTKTFRDLGKIDNDREDDKDEYVPPENFATSYQAVRKVPNPVRV